MRMVIGWIMLPFFVALLFLGYTALAFGVSVVLAGILGYGYGVAWAISYFATAWKLYIAFSLFTFAFLITFSFQTCCAGLQSFRQHLKHQEWRDHGRDVLESLGWPLTWFVLDRNLTGWGTCLFDAMCRAVRHWLVDSRRGIPVTHIDGEGHETQITFVKGPEDAVKALKKILDKD